MTTSTYSTTCTRCGKLVTCYVNDMCYDCYNKEAKTLYSDLDKTISAPVKFALNSVCINNYTDRNNMVLALANAEYKVWVEEKEQKHYPWYKECWVCWESEVDNGQSGSDCDT